MTKTLKDQNIWKLWLIVAVNSVFLYAVIQANAIEVDGVRSIFTDPHNLISVGIAVVVATVLNGVLSADAKARLVFMRWRHALPGHRAFSRYARSDARIDIASLEKMRGAPFPTEPVEENRVWYRMYKTIENHPTVLHVHRDFLLMRDYAGLSALFLLFYGAVGLYAIASTKIAAIYLLLLVVQFVVVRQAASNYGVRMVTTVLAEKASEDTPPRARPRKGA